MVSKVYFYKNLEDIEKGVNLFFEKISQEFKDNVGLKIHFGEVNNDTHINPKFLKDVEKYFNNPKFVECNVLYKGSRTIRSDHIKTAKDHGFGFLDIDILDGEMGEETIETPVKTETTVNAKIGKGIERYKNLISIAHFKGHSATSFGGALKNIGMGMGSRSGKLDMHSSVSPVVDKEKCKSCNICKDYCNFNAIEMEEGGAVIISEKCAGCAGCIAVCPHGAIGADFQSDSHERLMKKIADYTLACMKEKNWWCINFINNITYRCDCPPVKQKPFMKDIGLMMSKDPVAIDQASLDIVKEKIGKDPFLEKTGIKGESILEYAEKIGIGSRNYEIVEIE